MNREAMLVELVTPDGVGIGEATVARAHQAPGQLHRAFSVLLRDRDGRLLLQQRAAVKTRFPLRWANACCGHPAPGEKVDEAAGVRLAEELGVTGVALREVGVYTYRSADPATGLVEHEYDHVVLGEVDTGLPVVPDPAEVADTRWVTATHLRDELASEPDRFAPWLGGVIAVLGD